MDPTIRLADPGADAGAIADIYAPYCGQSPISFEIQPPGAEFIYKRIAHGHERYPWLVCVSGEQILGYAYAAQHHAREAYCWSVTTSVYVHIAFHRRGVGRGLYRSLLEILRLQGFCNAVALISVPHPASTGLHDSMGFWRAGLLANIGYKAGAWRDVELWQKQLALLPEEPAPPLWVAAAQELAAWPNAILAGARDFKK
ncbi:MAG TPA: GNAT family N-acetyltransferase [Tepidisphaeraceae bacterium]|jgi:phosphinothricin acetyltransferase|nr:GNAT family N-acetyltransferase [Tepidisphaeraceae bacterium]